MPSISLLHQFMSRLQLDSLPHLSFCSLLTWLQDAEDACKKLDGELSSDRSMLCCMTWAGGSCSLALCCMLLGTTGRLWAGKPGKAGLLGSADPWLHAGLHGWRVEPSRRGERRPPPRGDDRGGGDRGGGGYRGGGGGGGMRSEMRQASLLHSCVFPAERWGLPLPQHPCVRPDRHLRALGCVQVL